MSDASWLLQIHAVVVVGLLILFNHDMFTPTSAWSTIITRPSQRNNPPTILRHSAQELATLTHQSILDLALNLDPEWKDISFDFVDPLRPSRSIPCNIAFMTILDGVSYFIGTPIHPTVAVLCEQQGSSSSSSSSFFLDPDDDTNMDIMELAVAEFYATYGKETGIRFKTCPRALTVAEGNVTEITSSAKVKMEKAIQDLMDDQSGLEVSPAEEEFFHSFFKRELGDDYNKVLMEVSQEGQEEDNEDNNSLKDIQSLFNFPGLGKNKDEESQDYDQLFKDIFSGQDLVDVNEQGIETAQRLVSFEGTDGHVYTLTKLLQPMILVAKEVDEQKYLLTKQEEQNIVPKLEQYLQRQLETITGASL